VTCSSTRRAAGHTRSHQVTLPQHLQAAHPTQKGVIVAGMSQILRQLLLLLLLLSPCHSPPALHMLLLLLLLSPCHSAQLPFTCCCCPPAPSTHRTWCSSSSAGRCRSVMMSPLYTTTEGEVRRGAMWRSASAVPHSSGTVMTWGGGVGSCNQGMQRGQQQECVCVCVGGGGGQQQECVCV
jgi:hypothetical protein